MEIPERERNLLRQSLPRIRLNPALGRIELYLTVTLTGEFCQFLKSVGLNWDKRRRCWWTLESESGRATLRCFGLHVPERVAIIRVNKASPSGQARSGSAVVPKVGSHSDFARKPAAAPATHNEVTKQSRNHAGLALLFARASAGDHIHHRRFGQGTVAGLTANGVCVLFANHGYRNLSWEVDRANILGVQLIQEPDNRGNSVRMIYVGKMRQ